MIRRIKIQQFTFAFLISSGGFVPVGCNIFPHKVATTPMATWASDEEAKRYLPVPDMAVIYIYRDTPIGSEIAMGVLVDGKTVSSTVPRSFARIEIKPGKHEIISRAENDFPMALEVEAGKVYFLRQVTKFGVWKPRCKLQAASETEGRKAIEKCRLVDLNSSSRVL
jgi:hypothetical protein